MAGKSGAIVIRFVGDMRDLQKSTVKVSKSMGGLSKLGLGLAAGVGAVVAGTTALAVATTKDLMRVERLGKQTENVIRATGGAAGRSRKQVDALAQNLERMTGAEAETVTEGQNMLLTFKNIKGRQFDMATKSMLDMGVAMNKGSLKGLDLQKTSIMMGKALNDPIKGITALTRVGVTFTDQQKNQIKKMQEAGNTAGAQKVILKELRSEFGGAAKAAGQSTEGMIAKIQNTFGNISEKVFSFVLPMIAKIAEWVNAKAMPAFARLGEWLAGPGSVHLATFGNSLKGIGAFIMGTVVPGVVSLGKWLARNRDMLSAVAVGLGVALAAWKAYVFFTVTVPAIIKAITVAQRGLNVAMKANVIGIVITAIAALVAALVWFFTKTKAGKAIVKNVWNGIKSAIKGVSDWWTKTAMPAFRTGLKILGMAFKAYLGLLKKIWVDGVWGTIKKVWNWIRDKVFLRIRLGLLVLRAAFKLGKEKITGFFGAIGTKLGSVWRWIRENVFGRMRLGLAVLRLAFKLGKDKIAGYFSSMRDRLRDVGAWIRKNVFGRIGTALGNMRAGFKNAVDKIGRFWSGLKRVAAKPVNFLIKTVWNNGLRKVLNMIPGVNLGEVAPIKFAKGGHRGGGAVRGGIAGRDSVPALYKPGEHVWTDREVRAVGGQKVMYGMRKAALAGRLEFAKGGALSAAAIARGQAFARQQSGKPYGWGAVGPSAYDCSGFMSALTNVLQGQYPYRRRGATADFPWSGFQKGPGQFTIGSTPNYAGSGIGHMAGNLAGMGVESRGGRGVILGPGAMNPQGFPGVYHLGAAGKGGAGSSWFGTIADVISAMKKLPGQIKEMMSGGSWIGGFLKKLAVGLWKNIATWINKKIPDIGSFKTNPVPTKFASGGFVKRRPGGVHAVIGEGKYDEVVAQIRPGGGGGGGGPIVVNLVVDGKVLASTMVKPLRHEVRTKGNGDVQKYLGQKRNS